MRYLSRSVSPSKALTDHVKFEQIKIETMRDALTIINRSVWSPIVWDGGLRRSSNFLFSDYCGLDFDDSVSLDEAISIFKDYRCIIATTENHRKQKNGVYADRFRVVIPWERRIVCSNEYRHSMSLAIERYSADGACKDAGRLFKPSVDVALLNDADDMPVVEAPARDELRTVTKQRGTGMPGWLRDLIARGSDGEPGRNIAAFKIATACFRYGVTEVLQILKSSYGVNTLSDAELIMVIKSAQKTCGLRATDSQTADQTEMVIQ